MIIGIGIDLVNYNRIEILFNKYGEKLAAKILSDWEILKFNDKHIANHNDKSNIKNEASNLFYKNKLINLIAKKLAVTEAISKASSTGIGKYCRFHDLHLYNEISGKPQINVTGQTNQYLSKNNKYRIHISFSDEIIDAHKIVICNVILCNVE
ncbi:holo-ACP synthase [Candidatus Cytomitobacter primus]|uniref:Holo-[acyl-carrier-protein] synthase n=1 Tax=Candidatus Cytomitobacter primus TaxID=2066024 RepID=A0A5C0UFP1_9PROT|nr:holo-ACP synthase [Candidatus Cytomitobacter primus]QEK38609.1 holo-ACP synthase [Candidatus Cytomitobacter primus]